MQNIPSCTWQVAHEHQRELRRQADVARIARTTVDGRSSAELRRASLLPGDQRSKDLTIEPAP